MRRRLPAQNVMQRGIHSPFDVTYMMNVETQEHCTLLFICANCEMDDREVSRLKSLELMASSSMKIY